MGYRLGIDLGTTYTAAAVCRDGRAEMLTLGDRSPVIPSVVAIREDGTVLTGEAAERRMAIEPDRVAREFKRRFGDPAPILLGGAPYGAEALQAHLLAAVVAKATEREGEAPERVALTFPANWGPYKQELVNQVIALAGLDPDTVDLLTEPEAAAIHYASQQRVETGSLVAVYDLGGGTFDAAVLRRTATGYEIAGPPSGIERLGGIDLDAAVFAFVQQALEDSGDLDPDDADVVAAMATLRRECVDGKEALAADTDTEIVAILPGVHERIRLTRAEFEEMARPSIRQTVDALRRAISAAGVKPEELTSVLLVGGSSRMPLVGQEVGSALGRPVAVDTHPKYAVALGAALFGLEDVETATVAPPPPPEVPVPPPPPPTPPATPVAAAPVSVFDDRPSQQVPVVAATPAPAPAPAPARVAAAAAPPSAPPPTRGKGALFAGVALVLALVAAGAAFVVLGGDEASAAELVLEGRDELGTDPFSTGAGLTGEGAAVTPVTFDNGGASGGIVAVSQRGTSPGLYGGSQDLGVCDPDLLVSFLEANPDKAAAWASVHGIEVADIGDFVGGLTSVTLMSDTRVTNHGFRDGAATELQSVLEAGTAVMVDEFGVPRVKCNCGNPLLEPETIGSSVETVGTPWPDFDPARLVVVTPGDRAVSRFVLTHIFGLEPFSRGVGSSGEDDVACDAACGVPLGGSGTTTSTTESTTSTSSTTSSTTSTTDPPPDVVDLTSRGTVVASSEFDPDFEAGLVVDEDDTTSWFSSGPGSDGTSRLTWSLRSNSAFIDSITIVGNENHANGQFQRGFGFGEVEIRVFDRGRQVFSEIQQLPGTPDPLLLSLPGVEGDAIELVFTGHEDPTCGGFSELVVRGTLS